MSLLRAGTGRVDITPPVGTLLAGSLFPRVSTSIRTNLFAKTLVLESRSTTIALISVDLLFLERDLIDLLKARIERRTGIPMGNILLCCSHTHSGPYTTPLFGEAPIDTRYLQLLLQGILDGVSEALENLQPARLGFTTAEAAGIAFNSRIPLKDGSIAFWGKPAEDQIGGGSGPVDPEVGIIAVTSLSGQPITLVYNYSCHTNTDSSTCGEAISADYPGYASAFLEQNWGGTALFTLGSSGNVHPEYAQGSEHIGKYLGRRICEQVHRLGSLEEGIELKAVTCSLTLDLREKAEFPSEDVQRVLGQESFPPEMREEVTRLFQAEAAALQGIKSRGGKITTLVQRISIGDLRILAVPCELFVEYGLAVKRESTAALTLIVELANDWIGYVPTREAYRQGGYQTWPAYSSKLEIAAGEKITGAIVDLLNG